MQHEDRASLEDAFYTDLYQRHAPGLFAYVYVRFEPSASFSSFVRSL